MELFDVDRLAKELGKPLPVGAPKALEVAYLLSTQVEEGRPLRFAFVLSNAVKRHPERTIFKNEHPPPLKKLVRRPIVGDEDIRRVCLASEPRENCWRVQYDDKTDSISVVGLARYPAVPLKPPFTDTHVETLIEVEETASVSIRVGADRAKYASGRYFKPHGETELRRVLPDYIVEGLVHCCVTPSPLPLDAANVPFSMGGRTRIPKELYEEYGPTLTSVARDTAQRIAPELVLMVVRRMRELRHGGCLVLTSLWDTTKLPPDHFSTCYTLHPKEPGWDDPYAYHWSFVACVQAATHMRLAKEHDLVLFKDLQGRTPKEAYEIIDRLHWHDFDQEAQAATRIISRMTVIDGIVMLSAILEPMAFGGLMSVDSDFQDVQDKGARHRAGAYCAKMLPGSLAIVVSQDGSVTAYRTPAADVPVEPIKLRF